MLCFLCEYILNSWIGSFLCSQTIVFFRNLNFILKPLCHNGQCLCSKILPALWKLFAKKPTTTRPFKWPLDCFWNPKPTFNCSSYLWQTFYLRSVHSVQVINLKKKSKNNPRFARKHCFWRQNKNACSLCECGVTILNWNNRKFTSNNLSFHTESSFWSLLIKFYGGENYNQSFVKEQSCNSDLIQLVVFLTITTSLSFFIRV